MTDASTPALILRPPASEEEVNVIEPTVRAAIEEAGRVLNEEGVEAFNQKYGTDSSSNNSSTLNGGDNDGNNDASSEDAIVKGDARSYQLALLEHAKKSNSIIHLGTGQGKTLIALKLIDEYAHELDDAEDTNSNDTDSDNSSQENCQYEKRKQTWFLVPSVALAVQHTQTIRANLSSLTVETACHTASNSEESRRKLAAADVMVATHGAALDLLRWYGDIFNLQRVNLMVLDECHNCTGKHGYAQIMTSFYHSIVDAEQRPRILGLTASPIINIKKNVTDASLNGLMGELEHIMDARIVSYAALDDDEGGQMKAVAQDLDESVLEYDSCFPIFPPPPSFEQLGIHKASREKELKRLFLLYEELGPKATGLYCTALIRELTQNRFEGESLEEFDSLLSYLRNLASECKERTSEACNFGRSKKLQVLEQMLEQRFVHDNADSGSNDHVGLLFVERRDTAVALNNYLQQRQKEGGASYIRSDMLVRDASQVFKYTNIRHKLSKHDQDELDQKSEDEWLHRVRRIGEVLDGLRSRDTNLLIATSVVEEGVDVSACSFVCVFDWIKTTKSYVQMRGRARQKKAKFFCFHDTNPNARPPPVSLEKARNVETTVERFLRQREVHVVPSARPSFTIPDGTSSSSENKALRCGQYCTALARLDLDSSKSLLNRYFMSLPMDDGVRSSKERLKTIMPVYDVENMSLILPSHLPSRVRFIHLPSEYQRGRKKDIQSRLALVACVRLHKLGLLNERMLPLERQDLHDKLMNVVIPRVPKILPSEPSENIPPKAGDAPRIMYLHHLEQAGEVFDQHEESLGGERRKLGILALEPLPLLDFSVDHEVFGEVHVLLSEQVNVAVTASQWATSVQFFTTTINARWRRRTSHTHFEYDDQKLVNATTPPYVLVALTCSNEIDWDRMEIVNKDYHRTEEERINAVQSASSMTCWPRLWSPLYDPNVSYIAYGDSFKTCAELFPNQEYASYTDYMLRKRAFRVDPSCPLYNVQQLWALPRKLSRANAGTFSCSGTDLKKRKLKLLEDENESNSFAACNGLRTALLPQSACMEAPLADASLYLHLVLLPQISYHLEQVLTARAFVRHSQKISSKLKGYLERVDTHDILEALTAKSCVLDGMSYDRLEWLGDAVLKVMHTDALTNARAVREWTSCLHEGDLSKLRSAMGSNARLKEVAQGCGIDKFILTRPLSRGEWAPSLFVLRDEDGANLVQDEVQEKYIPSSKVMADAIEALLGLLYLRFGFDAAVDVAESMAITLSLSRSNQVSDHSRPTSSTRTARRVASFLGIYTIALDPSLLLEATTHASCLHHETPSYQKLEWIGDSVLSLAVRTYCFGKYPMLQVSSLVTIESTVVCNETLAYLLCRENMQNVIRHADSTLPSRVERFVCGFKQTDWVLWTVDPPKVLADVVESLLGAVHSSVGFGSGQQSALHVVSPVLDAISDHLGSSALSFSGASTIMHPRQVLSEMVGQSVRLRTLQEHEYALRFPTSRLVWRRGALTEASPRGDDIICWVSCCGAKLVAVSEHSPNAARNRASALLAAVLQRNNHLIDIIVRISSRCRDEEQH